MKRVVALVVLLGFLAYTGVYVFVYLFRAFRLDEPAAQQVVYVWHGDPMTRALLAAVLFSIGLLLLLFGVVGRNSARREGRVRLRADLREWLVERAEATNESEDAVASRAIASYRAALEQGTQIGDR